MPRGPKIRFTDPIHTKHRENMREYRRVNHEKALAASRRYQQKNKLEIVRARYERRKQGMDKTIRTPDDYRRYHFNYYGKNKRQGCKRRRWQEHEDYLVLTRDWNGKLLTDKEIADILERTVHAIDQRRHKLKEMGEQPVLSTIKIKFLEWLKNYETIQAFLQSDEILRGHFHGH